MVESAQTILIVDDDASQRDLLGGFVESLGFRAEEAGSAEEALETIRRNPPAMVLLDVRLPGMSGIEALTEIRNIAAELPVLLITAYADLREAVSAVKGGADDYLAKPVDLDELATAIGDGLGASGGKSDDEAAPKHPELPPWFVFAGPTMRRLVETIAVVAPSDVPVLITGESGVGKEVVARLIHHWSPRADDSLVTANCAGLPESLIESELFGHTKGAFTGATQDRAGFFRTADGGTLFLDEIGELPIHLQPKLLRAIESKTVTPVGSDAPVQIDTRLVAATNRNLEKAIDEGGFREDLYFRINVIELTVPPLRERREDILPLARRFAEEFRGGPARLSPQASQCLLAYGWPGNIRELRNAVQRACLLCRGDVILPEHLTPKIANPASDLRPSDGDGNRLSSVEHATIRATLEECNDNRTQAARKLGISRRALLNKIRAMEE